MWRRAQQIDLAETASQSTAFRVRGLVTCGFMRTFFRLACVVAPCAVIACSAILGDFSVGPSDGGGDGGSDAPNDVNVGPDSSVTKLTCSEGSGPRTKLNTGGSVLGDLLLLKQITKDGVRVAVAEYALQVDGGGQNPGTIIAYEDNSNTITPITFAPTSLNQVFDIQRYGGPVGGIVAFYSGYDQTL